MEHRHCKAASAAPIGVLLLALFYPALRWLAAEWLGNDYYSHGPLAPLISVFFAWRLWLKWPAAAQQRDRHAAWGLGMAASGLGVYLYALLQRAYLIAALAMIVLIAGLAWYLLGTAVRVSDGGELLSSGRTAA